MMVTQIDNARSRQHFAEHLVGRVLTRGTVRWPNGEERKIEYNISLQEAVQIYDHVCSLKCCITAETGVAFGVSTLSICAALSNIDPSAKHFGIDPNQGSEYKWAATALLKEHSLDSHFTLLEGPTHVEAPNMLKQGILLDFAFIDGWHTFDYTLLDFFYMDKMLRTGGVIGFHDSQGPAKRRVLNFVLSHRKYRLLPYQKRSLTSSVKETMASILRRDSNYYNYVDRRPSLIFVEKVGNWEPNYDFYKPF
jgi:hypothetical protein